MASGNMKDIKRRMKSVQSTMQITKAMELVASSKLRHARERVTKSRPYFDTIYKTMSQIAMDTKPGDSIYTKVRAVKKTLYIVIAGDRGLAGGYNSNVLKLATSEMQGKNSCVITIGRKAQEYYAKRDVEVIADYPGIAETMQIQDTHTIVNSVLAQYKKGDIDEAYILYTEFVSPMTQEARCKKILPLSFEPEKEDNDDGVKKARSMTEYDPSPESVFSAVVPEYLNGMLYGAVVESYASEQSSRRMAMESASDNASEMIENLNLSYNRARQAAITQEITEIVAGSGQVGS